MSDDPLDDMYATDPYDPDRLVDVVGRYVQIDPNSGEPALQQPFFDLDDDLQAVSLLLYRQIAVELGEISKDDVAVRIDWLDETSTGWGFIDDCLYELDFIVDKGGILNGFFIPKHHVDAAIDYLEHHS